MKLLPRPEDIMQPHLTLTQQLNLFREAAQQVNQHHSLQQNFLNHPSVEFNIVAYRKFVQTVLSASLSKIQRTEYLIALQKINQLLQGLGIGSKLYHKIGKRNLYLMEDFLNDLALHEPSAKRKLFFS